ncbi:heme lyase CcmF/NrfE family subunit [Microvirga mediterraneensis]|uniref:Heme lyase CcmF/NrfE family subunit n=1 Tax=Microvirga mediterraneensis TaxID=2754695 RepID=A0A838BSV7_9HYPH|nr:heme lyase CcmF/NrfE family subunit [Microvirga mediterraneensis]MBA1158894.1 heme lyase CcmF/NrfE family subunit [Microvirga mediterraneensis]
MLIEAGHYALALALSLSLIQIIVPLWGARVNDPALMGVAPATALAVAGCVAFAFLALTTAYVTSDFSVLNVVANSHSTKPMIYKISGVWGNHEGSMLLWVLILTLFGAILAMAKDAVPQRLRANTLAVQASITLAFLLYLLIVSNPFTRVTPAPLEGQDLNPLLQDLGLAIHPPLLYLGYVGFSISFAFAVAALIGGRIDAVWARVVRPWTLGAWIFLTLGIAMGSYWAYYELGWGGWWFWDPVENASFMPWLAGTALLHSTVVMERRDALKVWTILLAILTFSLSLLGTFLVRSGILTSVHSFAVDPARGVFILAILIVFIGGSLALFAWRAPLLRQGGLFAPVSREGALVMNNLFLATACATVFIGTLYPLALEALTGEKISVGAPFFNLTFVPLVVPLLLLLPLGQALAWKRGNLLGTTQRLFLVFGFTLFATFVLFALTIKGPVAAPLGVGLGVFLILGSLNEIVTRSWRRGQPFSITLRKVAGLPRSAWGMVMAHAGVGLTVIGIAASAWGVENIATMRLGEQVRVGSYHARLESVQPRTGPNYREDVARLSVIRADRAIGTVETMKRVYPARGMPTTEAGILTIGLSQIYISFGDVQADGAIAIRLYYKPLILLIWLGAIVMAAGGTLSLSDRRFRIGAPVQARMVPVPAE